MVGTPPSQWFAESNLSRAVVKSNWHFGAAINNYKQNLAATRLQVTYAAAAADDDDDGDVVDWPGAVCRLLRDGVAAVFGPCVADTSHHVQAVCETVEMPHFRAHWDLEPDNQHHHDEVDVDEVEVDVDESSRDVGGSLYSVSVHPPYTAVSRSVVDFVRAHDWNSFTVLYDTDDGTSASHSADRQTDTALSRGSCTMGHTSTLPTSQRILG